MRRGLLLTCLWVLGVTASVAVAFASVGSVASRVAPSGVARLSAAGVERELETDSPTGASTTRRPNASSAPSTSRSSTGPASSVAPPTSSPTSTASPPPTSGGPATTAPHNTVTASKGGTLWTRCSGSDHIVFVAAVPKSGYERTHNDEDSGGIEQWFANEEHLSKIEAECSGGVVHAEVEEEGESDDD